MNSLQWSDVWAWLGDDAQWATARATWVYALATVGLVLAGGLTAGVALKSAQRRADVDHELARLALVRQHVGDLVQAGTLLTAEDGEAALQHAKIRSAAVQIYALAHTRELALRTRIIVRTAYQIRNLESLQETPWWYDNGMPVPESEQLAALGRIRRNEQEQAEPLPRPTPSAVMSYVLRDLSHAVRLDAGPSKRGEREDFDIRLLDEEVDRLGYRSAGPAPRQL